MRSRRRSAGFTAVAVLTVALGIGANTASFGVFNEVFLRPAPHVADHGRLVRLRRTLDGEESTDFGHRAYQQYRDQVRSFSGLSADRGATLLWRDGDRVTVLSARLVTANYFHLLGVPLAAGRDFVPEEDRIPGASPVVIVSEAMWRGRLGRDPAIIGRRLRLNDAEWTVIGVAPARFRGVEVGDAIEIWLPLMMEAQTRTTFPTLNSDFFSVLSVIGRLQPGVSAQEAEAELAVLASRIEQQNRWDGKHWRVDVTPDLRMPDRADRVYAANLLMLFAAATALVLLIGSANLASLVLAQGVSRRPEIAMRMALGASRGQVVRQLIGESLVLAVPGAIIGVLLSRLMSRAISSATGGALALSVDLRVLGFAGLLALLTCAGFGLYPALQLSRPDLVSALKPLGGSGARRLGIRRFLVAGQIALSLVLLAGAGLFLRTLQQASAVDVGFETEHLLLARLDLELAGYSDARAEDLYQRLSVRLAAIPGVVAVSQASAPPVDRGFFHGPREIVPEHAGASPSAARIAVEHNEVATAYLGAVGIRLLRGRDLTATDDARSPLVAVINETMARQVWPNTDPIGQRFRFTRFMGVSDPVEVVGMMQDVKVASLESRPRPDVLVPLAQMPRRNRTMIVRALEGPTDIAGAVREEIRRVDAGLPLPEVQTSAQWSQTQRGAERLNASLISLCGAIALLLSALGLYGTQAYDVSQRTREIAVRMVLGATGGAVIRLVLRQGLATVLPGVAVGLLAGLGLTRFLEGRLYGVTPTDPMTFALAVAILLLVAVVASWIPARRAVGVDPLHALRHE